MSEKRPLRYEDAAQRVTLDVWKCVRCGNAWSANRDFAERDARTCCGEDKPCDTPGCAGRVLGRAGRGLCDACDERREADRWAERHAKNAVEWDGETPLAEHDGDRFFFSADELLDCLDDLAFFAEGEGRAVTGAELLAGMRLVLCEQDTHPEFDMAEFLEDSLCEDEGGMPEEHYQGINKLVNDWIDKEAPRPGWYATGKPVTLGSVMTRLGMEG